MSYDRDLAERLRQVLSSETVTEKQMFGGLAFLLDGTMAVAASSRGGLLVRVDPAETEGLLAEVGAEEFRMGSRGPVRGWVHVRPEGLSGDDVVAAWVQRGVSHARSTPKS